MKTAVDLIQEAKSRIREVSARDAIAMRDVVILDVREPNEWAMGHVAGAVHIPRGILEGKVEKTIPRDREVVAYCGSGNRSALAADTLRQMGYEKVSSLAGGFTAWADAGGAVED